MVDKAHRPPAVDPRAAALSGAMSGALASIATHPLDVVRTKLAVQRTLLGGGPPRYRGTAGTLKRVFHEEGIRGLFRGITPAVVSHAPAAAVFFSTYSFLKARIPDTLHHQQQHSLYSGLSRDLLPSSLAAGGGWSATCLLLNPLFVLKTKQQTQLVRADRESPLKYTGLVSSFRVVLREQGVRGLYAGVVAAMAGAPGAMIQMPLYEYLKGGGHAGANTGTAGDTSGNWVALAHFGNGVDGDGNVAPVRPSHARVAIASACSASCVGVVMYPMEVVRLRLQAQGNPTASGPEYKGIMDCFRKIFVNEGVRSFYRGLGTGLIRTVPQSAIGLSCYETILRLTTKLVTLWE